MQYLNSFPHYMSDNIFYRYDLYLLLFVRHRKRFREKIINFNCYSAFTHHTYGHSLIEDNLVINESGSSEEILDIESRIKELVDEVVMNALKTGKLQHS